MGEYGEVKYSPKPQDEENPAGGIMYRRMVDMSKAREGMCGAVGGGSTMHQKKSVPPPIQRTFPSDIHHPRYLHKNVPREIQDSTTYL